MNGITSSHFATFATVAVDRWRDGLLCCHQDDVAEEVPIALEYNGISHAVMLASPANLGDFALGFSLSEGIISHPRELYSWEEQADANGIRILIQISSQRFAGLKEKRRNLTGRTGCGLCGAESLAHAIRAPAPVGGNASFSADILHNAFSQLEQMQLLQSRTGATHAAAWLASDGQIAIVREDVGRHNALDKLIGAMVNCSTDPASGAAIITSRASYEMVQKSAMAGIGMLAAISAPTALAIRLAETSNITLIGFVRSNGHVVYAHSNRLT